MIGPDDAGRGRDFQVAAALPRRSADSTNRLMIIATAKATRRNDIVPRVGAATTSPSRQPARGSSPASRRACRPHGGRSRKAPEHPPR